MTRALPPITRAERAHRDNTAKAMRSMIRACPHCRRRGNFRKHWLADLGALLWQCHYCNGTWTAAQRSAAK